MHHHRIGLRREDKNAWERRVALTPEAVARLTGQGIEVWVERFDQRAFADEEYVDAGARLVDDVRAAEIVLGIKEMPEGWFREGGVYAFFSHTIKGQSFNMPMLAELVRKRCALIDYECVADAAGLDRFPIFAASQAVPVAIRFAHDHPDRVSALVFLGGYARGRHLRNTREERAREDLQLSLIREGWGRSGTPFLNAFSTVYMPTATPEQIARMEESVARNQGMH